MTTQLYIEYLIAGGFFSESSVSEVADKSTPEKFPYGCFAFRFFEKTKVKTGDGETLYGSQKNLTGWHFLPGEVLTLEDAKTKYPDKKMVIQNMENNNYSRVIKTMFGQFIPMQEEDTVLEK
jgi:hypothetical protein